MSDMGKYAIIGNKYNSLLSRPLYELGFNLIPLPDNPFIDARLSSHADLSVFSFENTLFAAKYLENTEFCRFLQKNSIKFTFIEENQGEKYPNDAQLNICLLGRKFIYNPRTASLKVIEHLRTHGREGIECKQGYTRCSVCAVDENSIITSDAGIAGKCRRSNLDVLEISPGHIELQGFDYGFIGGASIKLSNDILAFTGTLSEHPQYKIIEGYIKSKGLEVIYLTDLPAFDIGSAIIIKT